MKLEGAQRVHMSAEYTIMLSCTRLHVYIRTSLVMYLRVQRQKWAREHCLIQASLGSSRTKEVVAKLIGTSLSRTVWCVSTNE